MNASGSQLPTMISSGTTSRSHSPTSDLESVSGLGLPVVNGDNGSGEILDIEESRKEEKATIMLLQDQMESWASVLHILIKGKVNMNREVRHVLIRH